MTWTIFRPYIIVKNGKPKVTDQHIQELVQGFRWEFFPSFLGVHIHMVALLSSPGAFLQTKILMFIHFWKPPLYVSEHVPKPLVLLITEVNVDIASFRWLGPFSALLIQNLQRSLVMLTMHVTWSEHAQIDVCCEIKHFANFAWKMVRSSWLVLSGHLSTYGLVTEGLTIFVILVRGLL